MKLEDLIREIKEENLSKDDLEKYRDQLSYLYCDLQMELAHIEKFKAVFFENNKIVQDIERSDIKIKRIWAITSEGQREIVLKRYCLATKELLNSLKSRLYSIY